MPELPVVLALPSAAVCLGLAVLGVTGVVAIGLVVPPGSLPWSMINLLHEGDSAQLLQTLAGRNQHAGPLPTALGQLIGGGQLPDGLRALAWVNLLATAATGVLIAGVAGHRTRHLGLAALSLLGWVVHPAVRQAALSELGGPLGAFSLMAGVALLGISPAPSTQREAEWAKVALWGTALLAWTATTAACRTELVLAGGAVAVAGGLTVAPAREWRLQWGARLRSWIGPDLQSSLRARWMAWALLAACLLPLIIPDHWLNTRLQWAASGASPLHPSILNGLHWLTTSSKIVWIAAAVVGAGIALLRLDASTVMLVSFVVLARIYTAAGHSVWFEVQRYFVPLMPLVALAAADGGHWLLGRLKQGGWWPAWRGIILAALYFVHVSYTPPGLPKHLWPSAHPLSSTTHQITGLDFDSQREARTLAKALALPELHHCHLVARIWPDRSIRRGERATPGELVWSAFQDGRWTPVVPPQALADALPPEGCVVYLRTMDCALRVAEDTCAQDTVGLERISGRTWSREPYNDPNEYGATQGSIDVAAYRLR